MTWLLDQAPPEFRGYPVLRRHPLVLAWLTGQHVAAGRTATQRAVSTARADLTEGLPPGAVEDVVAVLDHELARFARLHREVRLVWQAVHRETANRAARDGRLPGDG